MRMQNSPIVAERNGKMDAYVDETGVAKCLHVIARAVRSFLDAEADEGMLSLNVLDVPRPPDGRLVARDEGAARLDKPADVSKYGHELTHVVENGAAHDRVETRAVHELVNEPRRDSEFDSGDLAELLCGAGAADIGRVDLAQHCLVAVESETCRDEAATPAEVKDPRVPRNGALLEQPPDPGPVLARSKRRKRLADVLLEERLVDETAEDGVDPCRKNRFLVRRVLVDDERFVHRLTARRRLASAFRRDAMSAANSPHNAPTGSTKSTVATAFGSVISGDPA